MVLGWKRLIRTSTPTLKIKSFSPLALVSAVLLDALSGAFLLEVVMKKFLTAKNSDGDNIILAWIAYTLYAAIPVLPYLLVEWLR